MVKRPLEKNVQKGENAGNQYFLLFPKCFLPYETQKSPFFVHLSSTDTLVDTYTKNLADTLPHDSDFSGLSKGGFWNYYEETEILVTCIFSSPF